MPEYVVLDRLERLERQVSELTRRVYRLEREPGAPAGESLPLQRAVAVAAPAEPAPQTPVVAEPVTLREAAPVETPLTSAPAEFPPLAEPSFGRVSEEREAQERHTDWETQLGGNWLNRIGAVVLVVGIALLLGYSFTHMGPAGRDAVGLCGGFAMLGAGMFCERRPRYQTFARGLIGGGWAAVYFTVYAMQALDAARVIQSEITGALLLALVALGMIAHSLRYRSEAIVGVAYFGAFLALAVTEVTAFSVFALIPLAASLLYIARRFQWRKLSLLAVIATYVVCASRGDTGAPLWSAQALFTVYWLLFEAFDLISPARGLMYLNAAGFLGISLLKWHFAAPAETWAFLAAAAAAYAMSAAWRARQHPEADLLHGGWQPAATLSSGLAAVAILLRLDHQWALIALAAEAEIAYLLGLRLRASYLRKLAAPLFTLTVLHLVYVEVAFLAVPEWAPVAAAIAGVFYLNRVLCGSDIAYGYAGAAVAALVAGYEAPARECGRVWFVLAGAPFAVGWWRRLADLRYQGYLLAALAAVGTAFTWPHPQSSVLVSMVASYALAACAWLSGEGRFDSRERSAVFAAAATAGAASLAVWLNQALPRAAWGPAWAAEALLILAATPRMGRNIARLQSLALAAAAFGSCWVVNLNARDAMLAAAAPIGCFYAAQFVSERGSRERLYFSVLATGLTSVWMYHQVSGSLLTVAWGAQGLALLGAGFPLRDRMLRLSGLALLLFCILKLFLHDLSYLETVPRIISFMALGLILVGVSWIYTRFRESVQRYL